MQFAAVVQFAVVFTTLLPLPIEAATSRVTILLEFEQPGSRAALQAMKKEIVHSLHTSLDVQFGNLDQAGGVEEGRLVVFKMKGFCRMDEATSSTPVAGQALASTFVTDGVILPFGEILCDRVRASVAHSAQAGSLFQSEYRYGMALASVMRHELYHMLSGLAEHTANGVTKESLSGTEMVTGIGIPKFAEHAMLADTSLLGR